MLDLEGMILMLTRVNEITVATVTRVFESLGLTANGSSDVLGLFSSHENYPPERIGQSGFFRVKDN